MQLKQGSLLQGGKYKIKQVLGQGGFGITYLGEQTGLGRKVAIKEFFMKELCNRDETTSHVSVPSDGSRELVARFREKFVKEARLIASFDNSHIVRIHDIFEENGTAYYVMENIDGGSISALLEQKDCLSEAEAITIIRQVGDALNYIHAKNVLHLDVKPSNILLRRNSEAVLIDFGISKRYDEMGSQTSSTPAGISKGYAPLEQYNQGLQSFSPATDVYSLGATLYRMVTGNVPPEASIVNEDGLPARPAGVSTSLWSAIEVAMQPRRKDRPQTISAWLDLLNNNTHAHVEEEPEVTIIGMEETKKPETQKKPETPKKQETPKKPAAKPAPSPKSSSKMPLVLAALVAVVGVVLGVAMFDDCEVSEPTGATNGYGWVDLGLPSGTKWATMNVGASSPSDYGSYFAWGETSPKSSYEWSNLEYCLDNSGDKFSKYVTDSNYGTVDGKKELDLSDDAAYANWGSGWRMPSASQIDELKSNCTYTWTTMNGKKGYKVTSKKNGNSIFLPAAGYRNGASSYDVGSYGDYWSRSLSTEHGWLVYYLGFGSSDFYRNYYCRRYGFCVRPVRVSE